MHDDACRLLFVMQTSGVGDEICQLRSWQIFNRTYPIFDVGFRSSRGPASIRIRMLCDNFNELPPSIELLTLNGKFLNPVERDPAGVFNSSAHPLTGRPFICMRGSREYHTHSSHLTDSWESIRELPGYDLSGILTQVWRAWSRIH